MNGASPPGTENQPGTSSRRGHGSYVSGSSVSVYPAATSSSAEPVELKVGKSLPVSVAVGQPPDLEVFTLTLGEETIELLPFKNWGQLDHFKWAVRGKLPHEPAGLDITPGHVKLLGESISLTDPEGCLKLERLFNDWLKFEQDTLALARKKANAHREAVSETASGPPESQALSFKVEVDKRSQVHVSSLRGRDTLASVGLTVAGFNSLNQQGLMRKAHTLQTGALHDWVELDGELFSFEKGKNDAARLELVLNERYIPPAADGLAKAVTVLVNAASSTGFDIQFPVMLGGVADNHRQHLNDESLELLQDPQHCGLLHKEIIVKLVSPNLVFKQKTADGGEQYLAWGPEHTVTVIDEAGHQKTIALSQPLNLLRLSAEELTAVFNHPAINRHAEAATAVGAKAEARPQPTAPETQTKPPEETKALLTSSVKAEVPPLTVVAQVAQAAAAAAETHEAVKPQVVRPVPHLQVHIQLPNRWLAGLVKEPWVQHDWFACLVYTKMAEHFGNSTEGKFGPVPCWSISLGACGDITDPAFKGIFLTEKGSLGFLNEGQMARFYNGVAFVGAQQAALEALQVTLLAVGLDAEERVVFIVSEQYRKQFGVPESTLAEVLERLREYGAAVKSLPEILTGNEPLQVVWTVPVEQSDPNQPEAIELTRPAVR